MAFSLRMDVMDIAEYMLKGIEGQFRAFRTDMNGHGLTLEAVWVDL